MLYGAHGRAMLTEAKHGLTHNCALDRAYCLGRPVPVRPTELSVLLFFANIFWGGSLLLFRELIGSDFRVYLR